MLPVNATKWLVYFSGEFDATAQLTQIDASPSDLIIIGEMYSVAKRNPETDDDALRSLGVVHWRLSYTYNIVFALKSVKMYNVKNQRRHLKVAKTKWWVAS